MLSRSFKNFRRVQLSRFYNTTKVHKTLEQRISELECEVLKPKKTHQSTIIWLHGLGDSSDGFAELFKYIAPETSKVVIPNAPIRPITLNNGYRMRAWYDIASLEDRDFEDVEGIKESEETLRGLLEQEIKEIGDSKRVVIGGFSMGCAMSALVGLTHPEKLAGIVLASGYLVMRDRYPKDISNENKDIPIQAYHGSADPMVNLAFAMKCYEVLQKHCPNFNLKIERGQQHEVTLNQINHMTEWFKKILE